MPVDTSSLQASISKHRDNWNGAVTDKAGVRKILLSEDPPEVLFPAEETLLNPVKRTVYVPKEYIGADMLVSGYSALAEYSMLKRTSRRVLCDR